MKSTNNYDNNEEFERGLVNKIKKNVTDFIDTIKKTDLPPALTRLRNQRILFSILVILISIAVAIMIKNLTALFGVFVSLYFIFYALKTTYDYATGKISEEHMFCVNVGSKLKDKVSNGTTAVFMDKDGKTHTLFYPGGTKKEVFLETAEYILYIHTNNPNTIMTYENL